MKTLKKLARELVPLWVVLGIAAIIMVGVLVVKPFIAYVTAPDATYVLESVTYVDIDPEESCRGCDYGFFKDDEGNVHKLWLYNSTAEKMVKGQKYRVEYVMGDFSWPSDYKVSNVQPVGAVKLE